MALKDYLASRLAYIKSSRETMEEYLHLKITEEDWHGVADAAMDLRDLEAEKKTFKSILGVINNESD